MNDASPSNLFDVLDAAAQCHGEREFLIVGRRREVATFRGLRDRAEACGRMLAAIGVEPGDRVAIWMTNRVEWAAAAYGAARCGAVTVGVNTRLSAREVAHMLRLTRPRVWIVEARFFGRGRAYESIGPVLEALDDSDVALPQVLVVADEALHVPGTHDWFETLARHAHAPALPPAAELVARSASGEYPMTAGAAAILSTSGTTAAPKGVVLGHAGTIRLASACAERQQLVPGQRFYSVGPFFHASGYMHALLTNLVAGSTLYTSSPYTPGEAWSILAGEAINAYHGSIVPLQEVARLPQFDPSRLAAFDRAWYSAPATEMARLESLYGTRMCEVYGLTETAGNVSICHREDPIGMRHDSDGRPHAGTEVAIVAEGWLRTGDQGVRLPGGYIKFLSRIKDVIRVGGENLSPLEVEEILMGFPAVQEAAVVAALHPRLGEVPVAFLVLRPGSSASPEALADWCRGRLASFKTPRRFIVVDDMPRSNAVNRVSKARLREMLAKGEV